MKRTYLIILLVFIFSFVLLQNSVHIMAQNNYLFPDNKEKHFVSADEFFRRGNLYGYTEYQEVNINFQEKLLYKDLRKFIKSNVNEYHYRNLVNVYSDPHRGVSPNRQVYFYCSILDNDKILKY